ncbi:YdeI/OmpD-associated family protein [Adhaeribacter terreus]|uniref:YdeI/OmpD-associated family protein n=1 Tax=Adhaeribacter terreus TaxID=529703 RepID=A0ABW0EGW1_9BACT
MTAQPEPILFSARIEQHQNMDAAYVIVPFNVVEFFGTKGQVKVKATFDGFEYRGSLAAMGGGGHVLGIRKDIRKAIGKTFSDLVDVKIERDLEPRTVMVPPDLAALFNQNPEVKRAFGKLSYTHQKEYVNWIEEAKKPETRQRCIQKTIENLLN